MFVEGMLETAREKLATIADDAPLIEAAKLLTSGTTDLVIVCNSKGALQGVVTKTDVVRQISVCQGATCICPASTVMTRDVALCRGVDLLQDVSKLMKDRHLKNIPVVDGDNRPVGVLTARAILPRPSERRRIRRSATGRLREGHWLPMIGPKLSQPRSMRKF